MKASIGHIRQLVNEALKSRVELVKLVSGEQIGLVLMKGSNVIGGMELEEAENVAGWYIVNTAWANSTVAGYLLFAGALKHMKKLVPSPVLTQASMAVIKRWYDKHKNDGSIVHDPLERTQDDGESFVDAGYTEPQEGINVGSLEFEEELDSQNIMTLWKKLNDGFSTAYNDPRRIKKTIELDKILQDATWFTLFSQVRIALDDASDLGVEVVKYIEDWLVKNLKKIEAKLDAHVDELSEKGTFTTAGSLSRESWRDQIVDKWNVTMQRFKTTRALLH